jgi:hypothetical protein
MPPLTVARLVAAARDAATHRAARLVAAEVLRRYVVCPFPILVRAGEIIRAGGRGLSRIMYYTYYLLYFV